jgi:transposase
MSRSLKIRKPNSVQIRRLHLVLEETTNKYLQRRAEAILFYASGLNAVEIAQVLHAHPNTIYADLHAFDQQGLGCLKPLAIGGAPMRFTPKQISEIWHLAQREPVEFGLQYGRWSLSNFQDSLIKKVRLIKQISREHLRRLLKKGGFISVGFSVS